MKPTWQRYAPIGLYLALAAAITAAGLYIVQKEFNLYLQIALGLVVIGLAVYVLLNPQGVRRALSGRQARYGSNALVLLIAFLGILVVVNFLVYKNPARWDLTEDKERTLAPETIQTLQSLEQPVTALAFFTAQYPSQETRDLLDDFKYNSQGKFDYKLIDPNADPVAARAANITKDGTVVLQMGDRQEAVTFTTEEQIASAMIRLTNPGERVVYFLAGHGEYDPESTAEESYSQVKQSLESKNYTVKSLSLLVNPEIPQDALALIVGGYRKPYAESEVSLIRDYLKQGGSLVVLLEPSILTDFGENADPLMAMLESDWDLIFNDNIVIDLGANPATVAIANEYGSSPVVDEIRTKRIVTLFPTARSVDVKHESTFNPVVLVKTAPQTWGETDMAGLQNNQVTRDEGQDTVGPVSLGVALEDPQTQARVVVYGDSDFAANGNFGLYGNGDLMTNTVDWAAQQENLINLTPKQTTQRFIVPPQRTLMGLILLGTIFIIPGAVILSGILTWLQRRRRG